MIFNHTSGEILHLKVLSSSFASLYQWLDNSRIAWRLIIALLVIHTGLLAYSAHVHSPTLNEPSHLIAGLSHWKFCRFDLYRVNPPLVRMVASLPVMVVGYKEDWGAFHDAPGYRPVFIMGGRLVKANADRVSFLFTIARWSCIPFSWIGAVICYLWARDLIGRPSGIMAATLWCFSPNILAHAALITADVGGASLGVAACYTFWRWLRNPTWSQTALTGCVLGVAELSKTTLILLYPLWPLLWIIYRLTGQKKMHAHDWIRESFMLIFRMVIGLYVLNLGYGFEGTATPLKEYRFVSDLFTNQSEPLTPAIEKSVETCEVVPQGSDVNLVVRNRFFDTWLGNIPVPLPKNYLLGIDVQQRDFEEYNRLLYLRGEWRSRGWWYYYLYAAAVKVPLGTWLLGLLAVAYSMVRPWRGLSTFSPLSSQRETRNFRVGDQLVLLAPPLLIFLVCSSKTGLNEHFRYVLPCLPFVLIWIGATLQAIFFRPHVNLVALCSNNRIVRSKSSFFRVSSFVPLALVVWSVVSSLWIFPHSLSFFNEAVGGPLNGSSHLLGSNLDWGQDVGYLEDVKLPQGHPNGDIRGWCAIGLFSTQLNSLSPSDRHRFLGVFREGEVCLYTHRIVRKSEVSGLIPIPP